MLDRIVLFPYTLTLAIRAARYRKRAVRTEIPTICVGNITVGGTGKTPHTEMILDMLMRSDRWGASNIAMLSLGYKRKSKGFQQVIRDGNVAMYGDEPLQIKRKYPAVTVAVNKNRLEGCKILAHPEMLSARKYRKVKNKEFPAADIVVLDDAFQYTRLHANFNVVLIDWSRPLDEDKLLPFGSLRDLPSRIKDADAIIVTKCPYNLDDEQREQWRKRLKLKDFSKLFFTSIFYEQLKPLFNSADARYTYSKKAVMFTGIANDVPLLGNLSDSYKVIERFSYGDHHTFTKSEIDRLRSAAKAEPTAVLVTTEKDAQRIFDLPYITEDVRQRLFYCPVKADFLSETEKERFEALLLSVD